MSTTLSTTSDPLASAADKPVAEMTLVEIAEQLERVTGWIEAQRVREREARTVWQTVATQVEANVQRIRDYAQELVKHQHRKMSSFDGLLGPTPEVKPVGGTAKAPPRPAVPSKGVPRNIADAILGIWSLERYPEPLTTEEIAEALPDTGYKTDAAPTSLRSSINQALAKLCRVGTVVRLRGDGTVIPPKDKTSRARKYVAASRLPEDVIL